MMVTALYENEFQQGRATTPPSEDLNQPGPSTRQIELFEMEECKMSDGQRTAATSTFRESPLYDEANFQEIELLPMTEEPLYQNTEF